MKSILKNNRNGFAAVMPLVGLAAFAISLFMMVGGLSRADAGDIASGLRWFGGGWVIGGFSGSAILRTRWGVIAGSAGFVLIVLGSIMDKF